MTKTEQLTSLLGPGVVHADGETLARTSADLSPRALLRRRTDGIPADHIVVCPRDTDQVAALLRWANDTRTPVVPFGAGSDVCEGVSPSGGVVLDMSDMAAVVDIDEKSLLVTAQAGCGGTALLDTLAQADLLLGHQPQSLDISTVGGWLATRACGQLSAAYGGIEDLVTRFEAVLPGGRVMTRKATPRRSAGPDVAWLMFGSEGTLGVVTEVTLRVQRIRADRTDVCVSFEHMKDGVQACRSLAQSDLHPTLVRLYDREDTFIFTRNISDAPEGPLLLLSFDGFAARARAEAAVELTAGEPQDPALVEHWWEHRNDAVAEYPKLMTGDGLLGPHPMVDTMEVSGTWTVLRDLYHAMKKELSQRADLAACHISHVYPDGACLYFTLASSCSSDEEAERKLDDWWRTGMTTCLNAGGSISHHHGIGRTKAKWLPDEQGEWYELLKQVKAVFDPNGIMNPGALGL